MLPDQKTLALLYGKDFNASAVKKRYDALRARFREKYGHENAYFVSASGRIEICGNHTDHNCGKVLVAAISADTLAAAEKSEDGIFRVSSDGYPDMNVDLRALDVFEGEAGTSLALVKGVLKGFDRRGYKIGGARLVMSSNVFKGAGVSSSASFELVVAETINAFYNQGSVSPIDKAAISCYAENVYFGKPCGLLDQTGISLGSLTAIDFKDPENVKYEVLGAEIKGYAAVLINTGGDHSNLTQHYAGIREDMQNVALLFQKKVLREVHETSFYRDLKRVYERVGGRATVRAIHFFEENKRVEAASSALRSGDVSEFLKNINASGDSSYELLQNCYVPGDQKEEIPFAIAAVRNILAGRGGVRVHGGGFAGTILVFVPNEIKDGCIAKFETLFGQENVFPTEIRGIGAVAMRC